LLDVATLGVVERQLCEELPRLRRVVVLDGGLEVLADRRRLPQLAAQPAQQRNVSGFHMGGDGLEPPTPCL
jgi:hypothetical protein